MQRALQNEQSVKYATFMKSQPIRHLYIVKRTVMEFLSHPIHEPIAILQLLCLWIFSMFLACVKRADRPLSRTTGRSPWPVVRRSDPLSFLQVWIFKSVQHLWNHRTMVCHRTMVPQALEPWSALGICNDSALYKCTLNNNNKRCTDLKIQTCSYVTLYITKMVQASAKVTTECEHNVVCDLAI